MWAMLKGSDGEPDPLRTRLFGSGVSAVDMKTGPGGDLFYVDIYAGEVRRIEFTPTGPPR